MKKIAVLFVLFALLSFALSASDLVLSRSSDTGNVFITTGEARDCKEIAYDGYTMPFKWMIYLTDEYAEFRFWWPDGRRMSAPGWKTEYTIYILTSDGGLCSFEGYTPDSYAVRISNEDDFLEFRNCLYENRGLISFRIVQHDYRSEVVHSPAHTYVMGTVDTSDIDQLFQNAFGESLYYDTETDPSEWLLGFSIGPSLTPFGNNPKEANIRFGLTASYMPYKAGSFSLGGRADVSVYQKNVASDAFLFDISASLYMANYFFINRGFSMRLEYGAGAGYIHNPGTMSYASNSFVFRIPLSLTFVFNTNWNLSFNIMFDIVPAPGYDLGIVALAGGGVLFRYGF